MEIDQLSAKITQHSFCVCHLLVISIILCSTLSSTSALKCPRGKYSSNAKCLPCPKGTYQNNLGSTSCVPCPGGTFSSFRGVQFRRLCLPCGPSEYSKKGSSKCQSCPPGFFGFRWKCLRCKPGSYFASWSSSCRPCSDGQISSVFNTDQCTMCLRGTVPNEKRTRCIPKNCPSGYEHDGYDDCEPCDYNTYSGPNMNRCEECPFGWGTDSFNGPNKKCEKCKPGEYITDFLPQTYTYEQVPYCSKCPQNSTTVGYGKAACRIPGKPCPPNTFEDKQGDCTICPKNHRLNRWKKVCVPCGSRFVSGAGIATTCTKCAIGASADSYGRCVCKPGLATRNGKCRPCPASSYANGQDLCEPCGKDTTSEPGSSGYSDCKPCPYGTYLKDDKKCHKLPKCPRGFIPAPSSQYFNTGQCISGRTSCASGLRPIQKGTRVHCADANGNVICPDAYFFDGKQECITCQEGWFANTLDSGLKKCELCPKGSVSKGGTGTYCKRCVNGFVPDSEYGPVSSCKCPREKYIAKNRMCIVCPDGFVNDQENATGCLKCGKGFVTQYGEFEKLDCVCPRPKVVDRFGECVNDPSGSLQYTTGR